MAAITTISAVGISFSLKVVLLLKVFLKAFVFFVKNSNIKRINNKKPEWQ